MMRKHVLDFERFLEHALGTVIERAYPLHWDENHISLGVAEALTERLAPRAISLFGSRYSISIAWEFYKLRQPAERDHGDIGVLVRRKLPDGKVMEGAGFLEAKLRDFKSARFKQFKTKQSNRILARSPQTQLVLYDYVPAPVLDFHPESLQWGWIRYDYYQDTASVVSYGPILPFALAVAIGKFDTSLYRFSHSFGQQFTRRYFNMLDLDFRPNSIAAVKGLPGKFDSPNIVMVLRIGPREDDLPETSRPNVETYNPVE